jgi:hypothetical protein
MSLSSCFLGPTPPPAQTSFSSLTKSPVDSLAYRISKTWRDASASAKKCVILNQAILQEIHSLRHLEVNKPSWQQTLNSTLATWIEEKQHEKIFKASPHFISHCQEQFLKYLEHEEALDMLTPIAPYTILIEAIASYNPSYLTEILFKKNSRSLTPIEQLLKLGHPSLRIIGQSISKSIVCNLHSMPQGINILTKLFIASRSDIHASLTSEELENVHQGLDAICPHLADIFQLQNLLLQKNKEAVFSLLSRFHQQHILWIDRLPCFKEICMAMIPTKLAPIVILEQANLTNWTLYFKKEFIHNAISRIEHPIDPLKIFRSDNFLENLKELKPLDFWIIGRCKNPIIHEIMGYIMDELQLIQIKCYLHALEEPFLHQLLSSLPPKNFQRVIGSFSKAFLEAYSKKYTDVFFPKKYDLPEDILCKLEKNFEEMLDDAKVIIEGWLVPGSDEFKLWIQALKTLPSTHRVYFEDLLFILEAHYKRYKNLIKNVSHNLSFEASFPFYCPIKDTPIMNPVKIRTSQATDIIYDKSSLMALRPLRDPQTAYPFSYFNLSAQGSVHYMIQNLIKSFKSCNKKSDHPLNPLD